MKYLIFRCLMFVAKLWDSSYKIAALTMYVKSIVKGGLLSST